MISYLALGRHGNTGNSMFQYAALIGASESTGFKMGVPLAPSYYDEHYECVNASIFDGFRIDMSIIPSSDFSKFTDYVEPHFHYSSQIKTIKDWTNLKGYFQSERYFSHCKQLVANAFTFNEETERKTKDALANHIYPRLDMTTSIHIRRGDFLKKQQYHPQMDIEYYKTACKITQTDFYLIFSDDIEWCKKTFGVNPKIFYCEEQDRFVSLNIMKQCRQHIICNSTFGWWGAWLGEQSQPDIQKRIVAPKLWFGPGHAQYDSKDIIPKRWIQI